MITMKLLHILRSLFGIKKRIRLIEFIKAYISVSFHARNYKWRLNSISNILRDFECDIGEKIFTDSFTVFTCEKFRGYLEKRNLKANSVRDVMTRIHCMLNKAQSEGYVVKDFLVNVIPKREVVPQVYLTEEELNRLHDLSDLSPHDTIIRDTFLIACYTGLRISDLKTLVSKNIIGNKFIRKKMQKTKKYVTIPLCDEAIEIFAKYDFEFPKLKTIQYYNSRIKRICKLAGITELILLEYVKGGKLIQRAVPKYALVSNHTGRRTAVTNLYLKNTPYLTMMQMTGHTSVASLMTYIQSSVEDDYKMLASQQNKHLINTAADQKLLSRKSNLSDVDVFSKTSFVRGLPKLDQVCLADDPILNNKYN